MKIITVLRPFGFIYGIITKIRNLMFDYGLIKSYSFSFPVISIGNISVGGTGKTPHTEYVIRLLKGNYKIAVLSRGYGRKTKGFYRYDKNATALTIGDEPFQLAKKFPSIEIAVDEKRVHGINTLTKYENFDAVILDDAFQHRRVKPSLNILIVDYNRNILDDCMLPAGRLREWANNRKRADIIIVSKCPQNIKGVEMQVLAEELRTSAKQEIFFTAIRYGTPYCLGKNDIALNLKELNKDDSVILLSGIASPKQMYNYISSYTDNIELLEYGDHHIYTQDEINILDKKLLNITSRRRYIITTEKDAARLKGMNLSEKIKSSVYVLPIEIEFINSGTIFDSIILKHINK